LVRLTHKAVATAASCVPGRPARYASARVGDEPHPISQAQRAWSVRLAPRCTGAAAYVTDQSHRRTAAASLDGAHDALLGATDWLRPSPRNATCSDNDKAVELSVRDANVALTKMLRNKCLDVLPRQEAADLAMDLHQKIATRDVRSQQLLQHDGAQPSLVYRHDPVAGGGIDLRKVLAHQLMHTAWVH